MIKTLTFLKRKPDLTREEFLLHWKETHGPIAAKLVPGFKRYAQYHPATGFETDIDGIAVFWWDSQEAFENFLSWRKTDEAKPLLEDEENFMDSRQSVRFLAEEYVIAER
jgi:uncharacterized protein (TIGR02118 family)